MQQIQTTETAEIQQDVGKYTPRPLRCFAAADAQFWCSSLSKSPNKNTAKNDQSELWMPVISTSLTVRASLEKRARLKTYHLRQFRLLFSDLDFIEKAFLES